MTQINLIGAFRYQNEPTSRNSSGGRAQRPRTAHRSASASPGAGVAVHKGDRHGATIRQRCFPRALGSASAALLLATGAAAQEPIRIGAFLSVTGPASFLGDPEQKTLELYVERLNAAGGVLGRKLQLVAYDDAGDAEKARTFAKRLLEQDKVDVIVGGSTTGTTMAVVPLVERRRRAVRFAGRRGGDRRAGEEMGVQDAAHRPHGVREDLRRHARRAAPPRSR